MYLNKYTQQRKPHTTTNKRHRSLPRKHGNQETHHTQARGRMMYVIQVMVIIIQKEKKNNLRNLFIITYKQTVLQLLNKAHYFL